MQNNPLQQKSSFIDPMYLRGEFFEKSSGGRDAAYKVDQLDRLLRLHVDCLPKQSWHIADVGCGSGKTTFLLQETVKRLTGLLPIVDGYDVHPNISQFTGSDTVHFIPGDFCAIADCIYDLAVLFDVIEHVPDPIRFIREVSGHARLLAFHIPLDDSIFAWIRNLPRENLTHPGHLLVLDLPATLNLLTLSGLRILDFDYSPGFQSPSGRATSYQQVLNLVRAALFRISPYLTQKLLAGVSLTVLAWTALGLSEQPQS